MSMANFIVYVYQCPKCEAYTRESWSFPGPSGRTNIHHSWTDHYALNNFKDIPDLLKCLVCDYFDFQKKFQAIGAIEYPTNVAVRFSGKRDSDTCLNKKLKDMYELKDFNGIKQEWIDVPSEWSNSSTDTVGERDFIEILERGLPLSKKEEKGLRMAIWGFANDKVRPFISAVLQFSLPQLIQQLKTGSDDALIEYGPLLKKLEQHFGQVQDEDKEYVQEIIEEGMPSKSEMDEHNKNEIKEALQRHEEEKEYIRTFQLGPKNKQNLIKLLGLFDLTVSEDIVTKAEVLRELGRFQEALELLEVSDKKGLISGKTDDLLRERIKEQCLQKDTLVRVADYKDCGYMCF